MTTYDALAAALAAALMGLTCGVRRRRPRSPVDHGRLARFVLWLGLAAPLPFLLLAPSDRFRLLVQGADGTFEAFQLLAFAAAGAAVVLSILPAYRSWWANATAIVLASAVGLAGAVLAVL